MGKKKREGAVKSSQHRKDPVVDPVAIGNSTAIVTMCKEKRKQGLNSNRIHVCPFFTNHVPLNKIVHYLVPRKVCWVLCEEDACEKITSEWRIRVARGIGWSFIDVKDALFTLYHVKYSIEVNPNMSSSTYVNLFGYTINYTRVQQRFQRSPRDV